MPPFSWSDLFTAWPLLSEMDIQSGSTALASKEGFDRVANLPRLQSLSISHTALPVGPLELSALRQCPMLVRLTLRTQVRWKARWWTS